ncbi:MAG: HD domain-containing protein, partial [Acidimicrobiia bacterium]|nr:HD domain-containing protein [Acidimicrobiia bacterium]
DLPAGGSIRFNDAGVTTTNLVESPVAGLRSSYGGALDAVRSATGSLADGASIEMATVARSVEGIVDSSVQQSGAALLLATVKSHDEYTYFHSVNVCIMAIALGRLLGLEKSALVPIGVGSLLHDIGKIAVSAKVLQHPGRLDDAMWKEIQLHPQEGAQAILAAGGPGHELAATIAFEHHARFDGSGYPAVARRARPHLFSRLVAVSDTYDAITTRRSYRRAETPNRALSVLLGHIGGSYDPDLVRAFIKMMGVYPPGSVLELQSGVTVLVTHMEEEQEIEAHAVIVKGSDGVALSSPEPVTVRLEDVVAQVLPEVAGVDPAALLEKIAQHVKT